MFCTPTVKCWWAKRGFTYDGKKSSLLEQAAVLTLNKNLGFKYKPIWNWNLGLSEAH